MSAALLTARQATIVELLCAGPCTMNELVVACGYEAGDRSGVSYVTMTIGRMNRRGWHIVNHHPPASHRGARYILISRPHEHGSAARVCALCRSLLNSWNRDGICWPCQRSLQDAELAAMPDQLFALSAASA